MNNKIIICLLVLCFNISATSAQQIPSDPTQQRITGQVTDIDGQPVRATIRSKHSGMTRSLDNGQYSLALRSLPDTLSISAIGYISLTKAINSPQELNLRMTPDVNTLSPVLVQTGYQTLKPNETNGTVSVISEQALQATSGTNILDRILNQSSGLLLNTGKTPGNPQNKTNISIRGLGTIDGPLDPLIVLDGFIYEGDIANINPNDIENVSILKDASASSIWGARAGNGVIVITSKKGKLNQALQVGFSAGMILESLPDLFAVSQMDSRAYIEVERQLFDRGYYNDQISRTPFRALSPAVEVLLLQRQGQLSPAQAQATLDYLATQDARQNYLDEFYTHARTQQYGLNLRGGSGNHNYYLSGNHDRSLSENFAQSNRLNLRLSNDFKLAKHLTLSSTAAYTSFRSESGRPAFGSLSTGTKTPVYLNFRDQAGNPVPLDRSYRGAYTDTAARGRLLDWKYYPLEDYRHDTQTAKREELFASLALKYRIFDYLQLDVGYQCQQQQTAQIAHSDPQSYLARDQVNALSQFNYSSQTLRYIVPVGGILRNRLSEVSSSTFRGQLNLDKKIGAHALGGILGAEARTVDNSSNGSNRYGYQADPLTFSEVDLVNRYPDFLTKSNVLLPSGASMTSTHQRYLSFYGNLSYSYRGKYHLSASARKDGSNIFGANTNDRWKPLWSAGIGWSVSEEPFYHLAFLPTLNLRATYGYSGNVDLSRTALPIAGYNTEQASGLRYARIGTINNPELKWEQLSQLDLKLDFATRKHRLSGILSYYIKKGTDLYGSAPFDYTAWGARAEVVRNVASMRGTGMDVELRGRALEGKFSWNIDLYFSINQSITTDYYQSSAQGLYLMLNGGNRMTPLIDRPLYGIAAYRWGGLNANGDPQGYVNGQLSSNYTAILNEARTTAANLVFIGRSSPLYFGALVNTFGYDRFSLSVNLNFKLAYYFMKNSINYNSMMASGATHADYAKRWQQPGDEASTHVPSFVYPGNVNRDGFYSASEIHADRADHARLSYIRLAYQPNIAPWGIGLRRLEVYGGLQEGGVIWRRNSDGLDPDFNNKVPPAKQFSFGLRGSF